MQISTKQLIDFHRMLLLKYVDSDSYSQSMAAFEAEYNSDMKLN